MRAALLAGLVALSGAPAFAAPAPSKASAARASPWYQAFPHPDTVINSVEGIIELDTRAKQYAALRILRDGMTSLSNDRPLDRAGEEWVSRRAQEYLTASNTLRFLAVGNSNFKKRRFTGRSAYLIRNAGFIVEVGQKNLPPPLARQMIYRLGAEGALPKGEQPPQEMPKTPPPVAESPDEWPAPAASGWSLAWSILWSPFGLILAIGGSIYVYFAVTREAKGKAASDTYGSARFADVRRTIEPGRAGAGVFLGKSSHPDLAADQKGAPIFTVPENHTLIVARSGTGKGTRVIVPTLLRYPDSMIVIDPKGENAAITAGVRAVDLRQTVHILNPWGELAEHYAARGFPRSATFNPLDLIDRNDKNATAIAKAYAGTITGQGEGDSAFWRGSAAALLAGVFLWLADEPGETKTLARARHIVTRSKDELNKYLVRMAASSAFRGNVSELISPFVGMADATFSGIVSNAAQATSFISDDAIKDSTETSSFQMRDLIERRTTVYIVFPSDRMAEASTWLRLILAAVTHAFRRTKRRHDSPRCMFLVDEFPALGCIDSMPRDIAEMRGYGLDFTLVVQGLDQLRANYGAAHGAFLNNCGYQWYCNISDLETAKYLSTALGRKTVTTTSTSQGEGGGGASSSTSYGETGRELLTPDEVIALGRSVAIAINPEDRPFYLRPVDYWGLYAFDHLATTDMREFFTPPIRYDENPYVRKAKEDAERQKQQQEQKKRKGKDRAYDGMSRIKALGILGLKDGATAEQVKEAYSRLMKKVHPDTGGTNWFAQQLNEARDFLLGAQ